MNKKFWIGFVVVFLVMAFWQFLVNAVFLSADYEATKQLWRPMEEMKMGIFYLVYLIMSFFFTFVFSKGYEGKGIPEGARYGFFMGMILATSMAYGTYGSMPIPYSLALKWFLFGLVQYVALGVLLAAVYGRDARVARVQKT
jgi:hypothetical protein